MKQPLLTIGVPNYNYGQYLENCLDSLILQEGEDLEILISDNASNDNSWEIIQKYTTDSRVRIIRQEENIGLYPNWNFLLNNARGKYFKILQSDDWLERDFFKYFKEKAIKFDPDVLIFGYSSYNQNKNNFLFKALPSDLGLDNIISKNNLSFKTLKNITSFSQPDFNAYKTSLAKNVGGFIPENEMRCDLFLFTKLLIANRRSSVVSLNYNLVNQRVHDNNDRKNYSLIKILKSELIWINILKDAAEFYPIEKQRILLWQLKVYSTIVIFSILNFFKANFTHAKELILLASKNRVIIKGGLFSIIYLPILILTRVKPFSKIRWIKKLRENTTV